MKPRKRPFISIKHILYLSNSQYNQNSAKKSVLDQILWCGSYTAYFIILLKRFIVTWLKYGDWNLQCNFQGMPHVLHLASIWGLLHISCKYISLKIISPESYGLVIQIHLIVDLYSHGQHQYALVSTDFLLSQFFLVHTFNWSTHPFLFHLKSKDQTVWIWQNMLTSRRVHYKVVFLTTKWWKWIAVTNIESTTILSR